jgi:hypothetical protein
MKSRQETSAAKLELLHQSDGKCELIFARFLRTSKHFVSDAAGTGKVLDYGQGKARLSEV